MQEWVWCSVLWRHGGSLASATLAGPRQEDVFHLASLVTAPACTRLKPKSRVSRKRISRQIQTRGMPVWGRSGSHICEVLAQPLSGADHGTTERYLSLQKKGHVSACGLTDELRSNFTRGQPKTRAQKRPCKIRCTGEAGSRGPIAVGTTKSKCHIH